MRPASTRRDPALDWRSDAWLASGWRPAEIALAFAFLGAGLVAATTASLLLPSMSALVVGAGVWVVVMVGPVLIALRRARPPGLFRVRLLDVLVGLLLGGTVRLAAAAWSTSSPAGWPSLPTSEGRLANGTLLADVLIPVVVAPVTEELFFRGVLLVSIVAAVRRWGGTPAVAACSGVLVTTGLFVALHAVMGDASGMAGAVSLATVAMAGSALGLLTGRIWSAVVLHAAYNMRAVGAALIGTLVGVGTV